MALALNNPYPRYSPISPLTPHQNCSHVKYCIALCLVLLPLSCGPPPSPEILVGEGTVKKVVVPDRRVVIAHEDIPGFMAAMTMSFEVNKPSLLYNLEPGDRVRFTLEMTKLTLYLVAVEKVAAVNGVTSQPESKTKQE